MGKILKLGFAMGGGVSLGTFNAGALSQTIKLAILYAKDKSGNDFDAVEIDVFSGASAGAISLALMLRSLSAQTEQQLQDANASLIKEFGEQTISDLQTRSPSRFDALLAAQVMQDLQKSIWVDGVNIDNLLAQLSDDTDSPQNLKFTAGLFNRGALENIAKDVIDNKTADVLPTTKQKLLAKRVLFASSLSNLTPITNDARDEYGVGKGGKYALADGMTSATHRETRVFDLNFDESGQTVDYNQKKDQYPSRWIRYHLAASEENTVGDMRGDKRGVWYKIISTAMASGAFPFAFEPVVLERREHEYGDTLWPKELKQKGIKKFNFTYVDGGVFNNEPIRDAFKLAAFVDAHDDRDSERCIVFVDPAITPLKTSFNVPVQKRFMLTAPIIGGDSVIGDIDGVDLVRKTSLDRLLSHITSLAAAVFSQARALEGDKIFAVRKQMKLRNALRHNFVQETQALSENVFSPGLLKNMARQIERVMDEDKTSILLPHGALSLSAEAKRIYRELINNPDTPASHPVLQIQKSTIDGEIDKIRNAIPPQAPLSSWYILLNFIQIDQSMRLSGKSEDSQFIAIGPFSNPAGETFEEAGKIELPGDKFMAFGGFMYQRTREIDMDIGKFCARKALEAAGTIPRDLGNNAPEPKLSEDEKKRYSNKIEQSLSAIQARLVSMIGDSNVPYLSSIPSGVMKWLLRKLVNRDKLANSVELRIQLPDGVTNLEFDGSGRVPIIGDKDIKPETINGRLFLITFMEFDKPQKTWKGPHVIEGQIYIDQHGFIDKFYTAINAPGDTQLQDVLQDGYAVLTAKLEAVTPGVKQTVTWDSESQLTAMHKYLKRLPPPVF